jgi:hypothetical protein
LDPIADLRQQDILNRTVQIVDRDCKEESRRLSIIQRREGIPTWEQEYPAGFAEILGPMQQLALFPFLPPELKMGSYFWLALNYTFLKGLLGMLRRKQYGAEPLDRTKAYTLAGQFFEMLAQACRGRPTQNKGRYNLELIGLVKMIQEHQTEKLSDGQIREALAAAGVSVPERDTWRIWLWRARKAGLIARGSAAPTARSKKPQ